MQPHEERVKRIHALLKQIAPQQNVESIHRPVAGAPTRAAAALESLEPVTPPAGTMNSALEKLAANRPEQVTPAELNVLEAIVLPENRPVVFVRGNSYDDVAAPWLGLNAPDVKSRIGNLLPSIGRIELPLSPFIPYGGTGFVVGNGLLMTNRHVAQLFSQGLGLTIRFQTGGAAVDFKKQVDTPPDDRSTYLVVRGIHMIHPYWDMALLKVDGLPAGAMLRLSTKSPEDLLNRNIVVIGYPARDDRNDLDLQDRIFQRQYLVKRLQPGMVRARAQVRSFENVVAAMTHDASTLGGNSGSAIIDVDSGEVLALHFGGEYLKANYAVPMFELARDRRVAPLLNFDGSLTPTDDFEPAWRRTEGVESPVPKPRSDPVPAPAVSLQSPGPVAPSGGSTNIASMTIPLNISVSIGSPSVLSQPLATGAGVAPDVRTQLAEEAVVVDQDYSNRPGYDPAFLEDLVVPLPTLSKDMEKDTAQVRNDARKNGNQFELTYFHYSVYMNKRRRTAWFSAANIDGDHRPNIGKRSGDRWYTDTRILKTEQIGQDAFEPGIDRGHLTRREDTAWGNNVASATAANNDTFHFTNCSLQASAFNRGKDRWQGLEQFLLEQHARKDKRRMIVITGPLFNDTDPVYKNDRMNYSVRCPLQFWKVCVLIRQNGTPSATAFILGQQEITDLPGFEEAFDVGATQIKIEDLEKRTGLDFGDLTKFDHFAQGGDPGTLEAMRQFGAFKRQVATSENPDQTREAAAAAALQAGLPYGAFETLWSKSQEGL
jgi:endonuclease G